MEVASTAAADALLARDMSTLAQPIDNSTACANAGGGGTARESQSYSTLRRGAERAGLVAADVRTTISVGWLSSRAAAMCFVMCSRWPPSAVPPADSSVFWVALSSILVDQRPGPLTSPTDSHCARVLREASAVAPSLGLSSTVYVR